MQQSIKLLVAGLVGLQISCSEQNPVPPMDLAEPLPAVSARYITERHHDHQEHENEAHHTEDSDIQNEWLFWRSDNRIEVSIPDQQTGEVWLRDAQANVVFYQKLFHEDQKIVEYQQEDLKSLDIAVNWRTNQLMISPKILEQLEVADQRWIDNHPALELQGTIGDISYDVTWLVDLNVPYSLEKQDKSGNLERTLLQEIYTDSTAMNAPASQDYEIIDYADLGDRERDPFVMKIQSHLVGGHAHDH